MVEGSRRENREIVRKRESQKRARDAGNITLLITRTSNYSPGEFRHIPYIFASDSHCDPHFQRMRIAEHGGENNPKEKLLGTIGEDPGAQYLVKHYLSGRTDRRVLILPINCRRTLSHASRRCRLALRLQYRQSNHLLFWYTNCTADVTLRGWLKSSKYQGSGQSLVVKSTVETLVRSASSCLVSYVYIHVITQARHGHASLGLKRALTSSWSLLLYTSPIVPA